MKSARRRRGYAMATVVTSLTVLTSFYAIAYRQSVAELRQQTVQTLQQQRDEGSLQALGQALLLLETGFPPTDPYVCSTIVSTTTGLREYTVTFKTGKANLYSVHAAPATSGTTYPSLPVVFTGTKKPK